MDGVPNPTPYPPYPDVRFDPELVELKAVEPEPDRPEPNLDLVALGAVFILFAAFVGIILIACL